MTTCFLTTASVSSLPGWPVRAPSMSWPAVRCRGPVVGPSDPEAGSDAVSNTEEKSPVVGSIAAV
jgi:hypothetical protein